MARLKRTAQINPGITPAISTLPMEMPLSIP